MRSAEADSKHTSSASLARSDGVGDGGGVSYSLELALELIALEIRVNG